MSEILVLCERVTNPLLTELAFLWVQWILKNDGGGERGEEGNPFPLMDIFQ